MRFMKVKSVQTGAKTDVERFMAAGVGVMGKGWTESFGLADTN